MKKDFERKEDVWKDRDRSRVQGLKIREYLKKLLSWNFLETPLLKK